MPSITTKTCSVSGGDLPESYKATIDVNVDFDGVDATTERSWAVSHLIISIQRVLKKMKTRELDELVKTGYSVRALDAGKQASDPTPAYKSNFGGMTREAQLAEIEDLQSRMKTDVATK